MPHSATLTTAVHAPALPSSFLDEHLPSMPIAPQLLRRTCATLRTASPLVQQHVSRVPTCRRTAVTSGMQNGARNHEEAPASSTAVKPTVSLAPLATEKQLKNDVDTSQSLSEQCERIHRRVYELLARQSSTHRIREVQRQTRVGLRVIGQALERYGVQELSFSYNGGKDCLVLLILYLAALHTYATGQEPPQPDENASVPDTVPRSQSRTELPQTLRSVYIVSPNPFPQVTSFVERSSEKYHLDLAHYVKPMKEAFAAYLQDYPSVRAIFVGTRRTDPHGANLTHFDKTDGGWPAFMRIHPVIDWDYTDIWTFIKEVGVEYCELYDMGYTSLGGTNDTHPNPALEVQTSTGPDGKVEKKYRPAYELIEGDAERLGRDR